MKNRFLIFILIVLLSFSVKNPSYSQTASNQYGYIFNYNLYYGLKNNNTVFNLQKFLKDRGYYSGPITGNYGLLTIAAVKKFQSANGVKITGYWGYLSRTRAQSIGSETAVPDAAGQNNQGNAASGSGNANSSSAISGSSGTASSGAVVSLPLAITTETLPSSTAGNFYSANIAAIGGNGSYVWKVSSGNFPSGLNISASQCSNASCQSQAAITGTTTASWVYNFTVELTSGSQKVLKDYSITVNPPGAVFKIFPSSQIKLNAGQDFEIQSSYAPAAICLDSTSPCQMPSAYPAVAAWSSSNASVARASSKLFDSTKGAVLGLATGTATITATYSIPNGGTYSASVEVFVAGTVPSSFKISPAAATIQAGKTVTLQASYTAPSVCSLATGTCSGAASSIIPSLWSSENNFIATVAISPTDPNTAVVTGVSPGAVTIYATGLYTGISQDSLKAGVGILVTP